MEPIIIHHNFQAGKFKNLWAKYVHAGKLDHHCDKCLIGPYSRRFSGLAYADIDNHPDLVMDEYPVEKYEAIYFCGVIKKGYRAIRPELSNYPHNVHFVVHPKPGNRCTWDFENWHVEIENGELERIPEENELNPRFFQAPYDAHYYTCRNFRWMVGHFYPEELVKH